MDRKSKRERRIERNEEGTGRKGIAEGGDGGGEI
jgi:hypothetical protein